MKGAIEQSPQNEIPIVEQVDNCAEATGQSKSTRTSRAILGVRETVVESGRSNVGSPPGRLGPVFSFGLESEISRLQEAAAASMATAARMAML